MFSVGEPPLFKSSLKPLTVKEGDSCKLEVKVTGDPVPTVTWFKDGSQIQDTSVYKFLAGGNKVALVIEKANINMTGTYKVKISNDLGSEELSATINVEKGTYLGLCLKIEHPIVIILSVFLSFCLSVQKCSR